MAEYMTKKGYEQLKKKVDELKSKRGKISKTIGDAREHGDLRENSAYHAAKEEQGLNEMRIREMEANLANAEIVEDSAAAKKDKVTLGATVKVQAVKTEREMEFTLVSASEADILENKISPDSPMGGELLGRKVGEVIAVEAPAGIIAYKILEIK